MSAGRATLLFCVLFAAALATAVLVVGSRSPELVLEVQRLPRFFTPNGDGVRDNAEISFFVRESDDDASVEIVDGDLMTVRTMSEGVRLEAEEPVTYLWDGATDDGDPAPEGRYRLRVELPSRDRTMVFPRRVELMRSAPFGEAGGG